MKDIVFIPVIDLGNGRSSKYDRCIDSWKRWCDKNDCELFVLDEEVLPHSQMPVSWQRYYVFDLLEANEIDYDQVMYVDADTIPHPDCPNVFEMSDRKFCFVHNEGSYDWILRSIENYSKYFFDGYMIPWCDYFDSGMMIFNKDHKEFFAKIIEFFHDNRENLLEVESKWHAGTDQTPVIYLTHIEGIDYKKLPYEYNMCDMFRKELLNDEMTFTKCGWIYQYNSIPNNVDDRLTFHWMIKTYEHLWDS